MLDLAQPHVQPNGIDPLTGTLDRLGLTQALERLLEEHESVAVLLADVDDFSLVTSSFGHTAGDHLLREISGRLQERTRPDDMFGRFGAPGILPPASQCPFPLVEM